MDVSTFDWATVAYNTANGTEVWAETLDGPDHLNDQSQSVVVSPSGSFVYVAGQVRIPGDDFLVAVYDGATGRRLGVAPYDTGGDDGPVTQAAASPDGSALYVTGTSDIGSRADFFTFAYQTSALAH